MKKVDLYENFWSVFGDLPESRIPIHSKIKPTDRGSVSLGYENGLAYYYVLKGDKIHVALYIARPSQRENKQIFNKLLKHKSEIENSFGANFVWQELKDKVPCRIRYEMEVGEIEYKKDQWRGIQIKMINTMLHFQKQLSPYIEKVT